MKSQNSNSREALEDLVSKIKQNFSGYSLTARRNAWKALNTADGKKKINDLIVNPSRPVIGLSKLLSFKEWLKLADESFFV